MRNAVHSDVSIPLRDMKPLKDAFWKKWGHEVEHEVPNQITRYPDADPKWIDGVLQTGYSSGSSKSPLVSLGVNFDGLNNSNNSGYRVTPPDPAGDVGPNHYVQVVNSMLQVYTKTGSSVFGPVTTATIWSGFNGPWTGHNDGDGIVLYDENADRWIISQFAIDCGTAGSYKEYEMIAVSTSPDPAGSYYRYAFQYDYMPDYPKIGVWNDGYYMAINRFNTNSTGSYVGAAASVMERSKMLTGDPTARMIYFKTETLGGSGSGTGSQCWSMMPSDCDGTLPATGTPNYFAYIDPDISTTQLRIWAFHTDWTNTANSSFTFQSALPVSTFTALGSVPQSGTTVKLDALSDRLMFRNQYRNFGSYESFVTCHSVSSGSRGGIRWYEYRRTAGVLSLYQQGTYAPSDGKYRWMGSIAMNANGDIGLAYSVSSGTMFPSIYYTGRKAGDALNQLTIPEGIIHTGTLAMTDATRWGDYTAMNIDPSDNQTFWTTQEYIGTYGGWSPWATKITSFRFMNTPSVNTLAATAITLNSASLNGTVNPNSLATNYHFEWGTTTAYGTPTAILSAGSGSSAIAVNATISGLVAGSTYHYRLVAVNSEGTTNGIDITFTAGAAIVTTASVSSVGTTSSTCGGTVSTDGGAAVTARGVCWATTGDPVASGNHTTDGSGTGTFSSSITGLLPNSTYYARAYATNSSGTSYGYTMRFTTLCEAIHSFPWNEGFENSGDMPNCWTQEQVASSGINWTFITGGVNGNPPTAHSGTYNACLTDATTAANTTKLITPSLNLVSLASPVLKFWHTQAVWSGDQDQLIVYYKSSASGTWTIIGSYPSSITTWTEETISLPNGSNDYYLAFEGIARYGYGVCVDDISVTGTYIPTWAGTNGNDWNTTGNWTNNVVPSTSANIIIPSSGVTNFPIITTSAIQCANLNILGGANIHINPGGALTVTGTLTNAAGNTGIVIKSDASGTGSLMHNTANVPGTIERYITGSSTLTAMKYHQVSIPLTSAASPTSSLFAGSYLYDFTESAGVSGNWNPLGGSTSTALNVNKGYLIYYPDASITYTFAGPMRNGTVTPALSFTNAAHGFNLVPNPYPSAIDWTTIAAGSRTNLVNGFWIWNPTTSNFGAYGAAVGGGTSATTKDIASGQAFFVRATAASPVLSMDNSIRLHSSQAFLKNATNIENQLRVAVVGNNSTDEVLIAFNDNWSFGTDNADVDKMYGADAAPQLSCVSAEGKNLSINALPFSEGDVIVPLNFSLQATTNVTFTASGMESFYMGIPIYLEDLVLNTVTDLRSNPEYSFSHISGSADNRFQLRFLGVTATPNQEDATQGSVFASNGYLFVDVPSMLHSTATVGVYDELGQQLSSHKVVLNGVTQIPAPAATGVYVVRVISGSETFVGKVVVK